jgi:hypothetical protein
MWHAELTRMAGGALATGGRAVHSSGSRAWAASRAGVGAAPPRPTRSQVVTRMIHSSPPACSSSRWWRPTTKATGRRPSGSGCRGGGRSRRGRIRTPARVQDAADKIGGGGKAEMGTSFDDAVLAVDGDRLVWASERKWDLAGEWVVALGPGRRPEGAPPDPAAAQARAAEVEGGGGGGDLRTEGGHLAAGLSFLNGGDKRLPDSFDVRKGRVSALVLTLRRVEARSSTPARHHCSV